MLGYTTKSKGRISVIQTNMRHLGISLRQRLDAHGHIEAPHDGSAEAIGLLPNAFAAERKDWIADLVDTVLLGDHVQVSPEIQLEHSELARIDRRQSLSRSLREFGT